MPDVSRSDSQRSNASQKPRVSFNRDVHVKRIVPRENSPVGAVSGDGVRTPLVASPVRKERLKKSKKELSEEAKRVLHQVDRVGCVTSGDGVSSERFYTLPHRRRKTEHVTASLERRGKRRNSADSAPPKKPPRTFASPDKPSIFDVFRKGKGLRRSASDAGSERSDVADENFRRRAGSEGEDFVRGNRSEKKQLSPIIEVTPREDYFSDPVQNKENIEPAPFVRKKQKDSVTAQLKRFIDEVDEELYKETGIRPATPAEKPQPIIIDVEKAEQISKKKKKFRNSLLGKKLKFAIRKKKHSNEAKKNNKTQDLTQNPTQDLTEDHQKDPALGHQVQETIDTLLHPKDSPKMIHSSQMPPEKLPLTKGRMVNNLVKRLSYESSSPPPLTSNVMITPHGSVQHNNNQPFSYTRGLNETSPTPGSPIIYAQVVCGGANKQTIHTAYNGKKHSQSDSDEGLGGEEHSGFKSITHFDEVDKFEEETPITPRIRNSGYNSYERKVRYVDSSARGRGDGMDSKRREGFTETNNFTSNSYTGRMDLSARRDQLESRINRRVNDNSLRTSPEYLKNPDTTSKYFYKGRSSSPVGYKYVTKYSEYETRMKSFTPSPETPDYIPKRESFHKSTPDIYCRSRQDSLQRASSNCRSDYLHADSGIENDFRRDSGDNSRSRLKPKSDCYLESEDEGFASSLLIASERQHTENGVNRRRKDCDSDRAASREDDRYRREHERRVSGDYAPRERSIDDGSHYDPRIDKDVEVYTVRRSEKKPPKPEKKSSLEKVKSLFTRDSKKKKEKNLANHGMVREESLRARYVEYKGREPVEHKYRNGDIDKQPNFDYSNRRRLPTPSPSPTRDHPRRIKSESTHGSWFKSLDRLSRKKSKKGEKEDFTTVTDEEPATKPTKNLRFFGDTDQESNDSLRRKTTGKTRPGTPSKPKSQSTKELRRLPDDYKSKNYYKSLTNVSDHHDKENKSSRFVSKPPASPNRRTPSRETNRHDKERSRRRKNEVSSVESSTEGDSSQQSQRSIVYLHAATVGDIPGPGYLKSGRRAASREELASNGGARIQNVKTLSRSFSVLAPWRPRNSREALDIDYAPPPSRNGKFEQKGGRSSTSGRKESSSTLKKKAQESKRNQNGSSLLKLSKSRESLGRSRDELSKGSNSTLYKKKDRAPKEHSRYNRDKDEKKLASKSLSTESLGGQERRYRDVREISRSVSMPRNPDKSAGWYKK